MKICLLTPQYKSLGGSPKLVDLPDPARYIDPAVHQFERRWIHEESTLFDIDKLCEEKYDIYFNYMWCHESEHVVGIELIKYLETKPVPLIGIPPLRFSQTREALRRTAEGNSFSVPSNQVGIFPKEVSVYNGQDLNNSKLATLCHDNRALTETLDSLKTEYKSKHAVIHDFIDGIDFSVIVLIMGREAVALRPLEYHLPNNIAAQIASSISNAPNVGPGKETVPYSFIQDDRRALRLKTAALAAFKAVRGIGPLGYSRIDLRIEDSTEKIYVMGVNPRTFLFYPHGNTLGDDFIIQNAFPGGHAAFIEVLLSTRFTTLSPARLRNEACATRHDKNADIYDDILTVTRVTEHRLGDFIGTFDYSGTVLDCCSGSGAFAKLALQKGVEAEFSAVDISAGMASLPACKLLYKQPILLGAAQEVLMRAGMHDHVVCFGSFHLFSRMDLFSTLCQMFLLARKSVSFDVDDLSPAYIDGSVGVTAKEHGTAWLDFNYNNVAAAVSFGIPKGWQSIIYNQRRFAYHSPLMAEDVYTHSFRFEKNVVKY